MNMSNLTLLYQFLLYVIFQANNVGKLNLEQINDQNQHVAITSLKLSNLQQLKVKFKNDKLKSSIT